MIVLQLTVFFTILCLAYTVGFILADYLMSVDAANTWPLAEGAFGASLWSTVIVSFLSFSHRRKSSLTISQTAGRNRSLRFPHLQLSLRSTSLATLNCRF